MYTCRTGGVISKAAASAQVALQALRGLPSGQAAGMVDCAASFAAGLCPTEDCLPGNAARGRMCLALLQGLRVSAWNIVPRMPRHVVLPVSVRFERVEQRVCRGGRELPLWTQVEYPTAQPIAAAVERFLREPMSRLLDSQHSAFLRPPSDAELQHAALVLRVLAAALRLHAECRGFDPQITPLGGQFIGDDAASSEAEGGADVHAGYFSVVGLPADALLSWAQRLQATGGLHSIM